MRVIVCANGELPNPRKLLETIGAKDVLLAADGGARHYLQLGLTPRYVIGDFDSLSEVEIQQLQAMGVQLERHPRRKDETDLELTLLRARDFQPDAVLVFGALGGRWDMTLANLLLAAHPALVQVDIRFMDGQQEIRLLRGGQTAAINGNPGDTLSLIPLGGDAGGITTQGLEYALADGVLTFGTARGVSNVLTGAQASVELGEGMLLMVHVTDDRPQTTDGRPRSVVRGPRSPH